MSSKQISISNWMCGLGEERKLFELCLPGSHDAGVYQDKKHQVEPNFFARCQDADICQQAEKGSRVFDIRCFIPEEDRTVKMGHFFIEREAGFLGCYGGTLEQGLQDAAKFLTTYETEFIIFRISHTECTKAVFQIVERFRATYDKLIFKGAAGDLVDLKVRQLRGKLLLVFAKEFYDSSKKFNHVKFPDFSVARGYYPFRKHGKAPLVGPGDLSFCGLFDKKNSSEQGAVENANEGCQRHQNHSQQHQIHLLWVYWQKTYGDVETNAKGMHARLDQFLQDIRDGKLPRPNVIGHDFVDQTTCTKIVKLNPDMAAHLRRPKAPLPTRRDGLDEGDGES